MPVVIDHFWLETSMFTRQYTCPKCSKTVTFPKLPLFKKRQCPHCGRDIMEWDVKPEHRQHGGIGAVVPPKVVYLVVVLVLIGAVVYFVASR
jgi:DNA-directed RNA polymerase subunit RPC12/RpoP